GRGGGGGGGPGLGARGLGGEEGGAVAARGEDQAPRFVDYRHRHGRAERLGLLVRGADRGFRHLERELDHGVSPVSDQWPRKMSFTSAEANRSAEGPSRMVRPDSRIEARRATRSVSSTSSSI